VSPRRVAHPGLVNAVQPESARTAGLVGLRADGHPEGSDASGLTDIERGHIAAELRRAEAQRVAIRPVSRAYPHMNVHDAYLVQLINVRARIEAGATVGGHKVGLSSKAMQEMMGVGEPDYGHLLADMFVGDGDEIDMSTLVQPRVEVEPAFVLGATLPAPGCTVEDVVRCTAYVAPSLEIIDSRIADWTLTLCDTIADNASSGRLVLGASRILLGDVDLGDTKVTLRINDRVVDSGNTNAVLGNPMAAVAWLANKVYEYGVTLQSGHVVLPGSCTRAHDVSAGDTVHADFETLGVVSVRFR
jgi:2-keto-4-pentenoate hydratase